MRIVSFIISTIVTILLIIAFNFKWGAIPPVGKFLSPQQGFWQNAEPTDARLDQQIVIRGLKGTSKVYLDDRLVPHIFAQNDEDAYYIQGYLHAKYRLWQMEFQTFAAAGRISEILGNDPRFLRFDREQRRLGMVYGAENSVKAMEADTATRRYFDAYTSGVNEYINTLSESQLPIEYKLLDYHPESWSNLKIGLFLKLMSKDLAGYERDLEFTNEKSEFGLEKMMALYPELSDSSLPIIPKGTVFDTPGIKPIKPPNADSIYFGKDTSVHAIEVNKPNPDNGSNNWAVSGKRTKSGAPILCNDPHLTLSLPSIWYEMQISTPTMNVYGATFPGSPNVIIGFNDSLAFGFTNSERDVKDYYSIRFKDQSKKEYWFNNQWTSSQMRVEHIKIRGAEDFNDTVAYTVFGPVMYDQSFVYDSTHNNALAVRWSAHDPSNEGACWIKLNHAKNYNDYLDAIKDFTCPGQNMLVATKSGDIALWQQAKFPARWQGQGLYIMPGEDSSYMWQGYIPQKENPHIINPESGYIFSANQRPVDSTYPYFIPGNYIVPRGITLGKKLSMMQQVTPDDMKMLQNDYYSSTASTLLPLLIKYLDTTSLNAQEKKYLGELRSWDYYASAASRATTIYQAWFDSLKHILFDKEFAALRKPIVMPEEQTVVELLARDSSFRKIDEPTVGNSTTIQQITNAFHEATVGLQAEENKDGLIWWKHREPSIYHLLRASVKPFARIGLHDGGWYNTINALTETHGPSWRMIVHLTNPTEAYGVYPGGQSGNPGSKFYDNFIDTWASGKYYTLWIMKEEEGSDKRVIGTLTITNG
jgi:Protein related to penicillin acylase